MSRKMRGACILWSIVSLKNMERVPWDHWPEAYLMLSTLRVLEFLFKKEL